MWCPYLKNSLNQRRFPLSFSTFGFHFSFSNFNAKKWLRKDFPEEIFQVGKRFPLFKFFSLIWALLPKSSQNLFFARIHVRNNQDIIVIFFNSMPKKILIASVSFFVFVAVLAGIVFVEQKKKKQQAEQIQIQKEEEQQSKEDQKVNELLKNQEEELDTSNWQIYQDKDRLFTLKYPPNWNYRIAEDGRIEFRENGKKYESEGLDASAISISIGDERYPNRMSTQKYIETTKNSGGEIFEMIIDGKNAYKIYPYLPALDVVIIYEEEGDKNLSISTPDFGSVELMKELREITIAMAKSIEFK